MSNFVAFRTVRTWKGQTLSFVRSSVSYIDVSFNGVDSDCIGTWNYECKESTIGNRDDFLSKVADYMTDKGNLWDHLVHAAMVSPKVLGPRPE